jgi:hypothetical protein
MHITKWKGQKEEEGSSGLERGKSPPKTAIPLQNTDYIY